MARLLVRCIDQPGAEYYDAFAEMVDDNTCVTLETQLIGSNLNGIEHDMTRYDIVSVSVQGDLVMVYCHRKGMGMI